jgi:sialic acid synthase SpsE
VVPVAAVVLGAEIIEKHITLDRSMKGSDHAGALEPDGLWRMVRDIRNVELALGTATKDVHPSVAGSAGKLRRSLAIRRDIREGERITKDDLIMLSPGGGLPWTEKDRIVDRVAARDLKGHSHVFLKDVV